MAAAGAWAGELVGRSPELDRIDDVLADVESGSFRVIAIRGEPGVGKTRLLGELAGRAARRALTVHRGRATEFEQGVPFGIFIDAFERASSAQPESAELTML